MKKILILFFLSIPAVAQAQQQKIYGTWQNSQLGYQLTLILKRDGTGELDGEQIKYVNEPGILSVTAEGETIKYSYVLSDNSLTLSGGDFEGKVIFKRNGEAGLVEKAKQVPIAQTTTRINKALLGSWSTDDETIQFNPDGTCIYLDKTFLYEATPDNVTLTTSNGKVTFAYEVKGRELTLLAEGQYVVYTKATVNSN